MLRIGIAYSLAPAEAPGGAPDDAFEEFDKPETIDALIAVMRGLGHDPYPLGDGRALIEHVLADRPDFVFNIAEGEGTGRNREARVPAFLEMLGIPYSGSDPLTLAATLDKDVAKRLVRGAVSVPHDLLLMPDLEVEADLRSLIGLAILRCDDPFDTDPEALLERFLGPPDDELPTPVILKPNLEGSSKGVRGRCVANTITEAVAHFRELARAYQQPILIEEYVQGDEVTVGVLGNGEDARVLGAMRITPKVPDKAFVYSLEVKRDWRNRVEYESPARLEPVAMERLEEVALSAYHLLGCRDVARIDFRIRPDGEPFFLEANPLPGLSPETSDLAILARGYGVSHEDLIARILDEGLRRAGLSGGRS